MVRNRQLIVGTRFLGFVRSQGIPWRPYRARNAERHVASGVARALPAALSRRLPSSCTMEALMAGSFSDGEGSQSSFYQKIGTNA
jgi:hypothetical protein